MSQASLSKAIEVRPARPKDIEVVLRMLQSLAQHEGADAVPQLTAETLLIDAFGPSQVLHVFIGEVVGKTSGFITAFETYSTWQGGRTLHVGDLWVEPHVRGRGLGGRLVAHVLETFPNRRIDVYVARGNHARSFYEALGFKEQQHWCLYRRDI